MTGMEIKRDVRSQQNGMDFGPELLFWFTSESVEFEGSVFSAGAVVISHTSSFHLMMVHQEGDCACTILLWSYWRVKSVGLYGTKIPKP